MSVSLEQFVQHLTESGLISAAEISLFLDSLPPESKPKDGETLARELLEAKKLTEYQAAEIRRGNAYSLVFGEYIVLDKIGQGGMGVVLKAGTAAWSAPWRSRSCGPRRWTRPTPSNGSSTK